MRKMSCYRHVSAHAETWDNKGINELCHYEFNESEICASLNFTNKKKHSFSCFHQQLITAAAF